jgi:alkylated DNA repair dioxygenase AlkB
MLYHYSGKEMTGQIWDPVVDAIRDRLYRICEAEYPGWNDTWRFDTCLCNYYRSKEELVKLAPKELEEISLEEWKPDVIGLHADSEQDLIVDRPIASVSFGATRRFDLRPNLETKGRSIVAPIPHEVIKTYLASGSLFIMGSGTQRYYKHEIPAEKKVFGGRINLTFRMTKTGVVEG